MATPLLVMAEPAIRLVRGIMAYIRPFSCVRRRAGGGPEKLSRGAGDQTRKAVLAFDRIDNIIVIILLLLFMLRLWGETARPF